MCFCFLFEVVLGMVFLSFWNFREIALAPNPERISQVPGEKDYMLKMADVHAGKLRARLVVLSCCHSAQGNVTVEGVVGIARAFLGAIYTITAHVNPGIHLPLVHYTAVRMLTVAEASLKMVSKYFFF